MEQIDVNNIIVNFINDMDYLKNDHVLGCFFYGSYLTGYNDKNSDVDLTIIFDDEDPNRLVRGNKHINGIRIEYFEKPISDIYLSIDNDYENQNNSLLSIIGTSRIIFDKNGSLKELQSKVLEKFSQPLPPLNDEDAREYVSILNNRMEKLEKAAIYDEVQFNHLYHLTIEKIRKFYHHLKGLPEVQTSKIFRVYNDAEYRKSFYKDNIPEKEFVDMYLSLISDESRDKLQKLDNIRNFYEYSKRDVSLDKEEFRIKIKSRNKK